MALVLWLLDRSRRTAGPGAETASGIRHVILISIATCRADYLSCYGYERQTTPSIDALAAVGCLFENVVSPVPQTLPAHSSMLTGTIPPYHGVHDNKDYRLDGAQKTIAEILKDNGFVTGAAISAFVLESSLGLAQGFQTYYDDFETASEGAIVWERQADEATGIAIDWLEQHKNDRGFFFLHYYDPHKPYLPPEPFASRYADNLYAGEIAYTDHCIGRVIDKLKALGIYESSLIIITADHGEMLGEHGEDTHTYFIYESAIKVPLIVKTPSNREPRRVSSIAGIVDIVPTICGQLDIDVPQHVQGLDLTPQIEGESAPQKPRQLFCESLWATKYQANSLLGVVTDRFKYIQTTRPELYNLIKDPAEQHNLVADHPEQAKFLQATLAQMIEAAAQAATDGRTEFDTETRRRIESLGYIGGPIEEEFSFDQSKADPKDLIAYHELAEAVPFAYEAGEYDKVLQICEEQIRLQPDLPFPWGPIGKIALTRGELDKAIGCFSRILELDRNHSASYDARGDAYARQGRHELAIRDYSEAIELIPQASFFNKRGQALMGLGKFDRAIPDFHRALQLDGEYASAWNNRGLAYMRRGEMVRSTEHVPQALSDFSRAITLEPTNSAAWYNRGLLHANVGEEGLAIGDLRKVIELTPDNAVPYADLARVLLRQGKATEGVASYRQALQRRAEWPQVMNELAWRLATYADQSLRDGAEAVRLAERASVLVEHKHPVFLDTLAAAYAEAGEFTKAVETAERVLQMAVAAGDTEVTADIRKRLDLYKAGKPYRVP